MTRIVELWQRLRSVPFRNFNRRERRSRTTSNVYNCTSKRIAIPDGRQRAVLLSVVGSKTYTVLSDLLAPALPREKTFAEISTVLKQHFEPKRVVIAEYYHFHKREQLSGESMADYEAALRRLATNCKFGEFLGQALRDRFVCGLRNEAVQRRLLSEKDLIHTKAIEIAQAMEVADQNVKSLKGTEPSIHQFDSQTPDRAPCTHCGRKNHKPQDCHFREAVCDISGKKATSPRCADRDNETEHPAVDGDNNGTTQSGYPTRTKGATPTLLKNFAFSRWANDRRTR